MELKRTKVVMLPTEEELRIGDICTSIGPNYLKKPLIFGNFENSYINECKKQHLYFTSKGDIKEGDYYIVAKRVVKCTTPVLDKPNFNGKIIATTDKSLTIKKDKGVGWLQDCYFPQPSRAFIEKYCTLDGIDEVMVEYEMNIASGLNNISTKGKESAYFPKVNSHNEIIIHPIKDSWSREEVEKLVRKALNQEGLNIEFGKTNDINNWIKENLNK